MFDDKIIFSSAFCSGNMSKVARSATGGPYAVTSLLTEILIYSLTSGFHKMLHRTSKETTIKLGSTSVSQGSLSVRQLPLTSGI